jgi:RND superfamily putative drug exporter
VSRWAIARPRAALTAWVVAIAVFAVLGLGVEGRLTQSIFVLPGSETERAIEISREEFGESVFIPVLLEGPPAEVDRQGHELVRRLTEAPDTQVLSPWDRAPSAEALRPEPGAAMVVAAINRPYEEIFDSTAEEMRGLVDEVVSEPVEASVTGMPLIGNAIKRETYDSAREAELIAIPVLLIVLLLVFRAPIAAAIPGAIGLATLLAGAGVIWLLAGFLRIDPLAISLASMMGLALGVDYSLLIVTRFREETAAGAPPPIAAATAMATAGRTVGFAGAAVVVAMLVGIAVVPGDILVSAAVGVLTATAIALASAFVAIPAVLALAGAHIDRFGFARDRSQRPRWLVAVAGALRQPGLVAGLVALPLLFLAAPAFGLNTGPPDVAQLPADDPARQDFERVSEVMGPGWAAPFDVLVVDDNGLITDGDRLARLRRWQRELVHTDGVATVVGPGQLANRIPDFSSQGAELQRGADGIARLARGMERAEDAVRELRAGQALAAEAARKLAAGGEEGADGSHQLAERLADAADGAGMIAAAVERLAGGGERMREALHEAKAGSQRLSRGLRNAADAVSVRAVTAAELLAFSLESQAILIDEVRPRASNAEASLRSALDELEAMTTGKSDPRYAAALQAVSTAYVDIARRDPATDAPLVDDPESMERELELFSQRIRESQSQAERLAAASRKLARKLREAGRGAGELAEGLGRLRDGAGRLDDGAGEVRAALAELEGGLYRAVEGTEELAGGLEQLADGNAELASGMADAQSRVLPLIYGLDRGARGAQRIERRSRESLDALSRTRGIFDSGYFVLAAIDGTDPDRRAAAQVAVNVNSGGEAGRVLVVPTTAPNDPGTRALHSDLRDRVAALGDELGLEAALGGTAGALAEYDERASARLIWLILALAVVSSVALAPIFGSFLLPALAVGLNLISVGAAFGALALLFQGDAPPLGGPGYIDVVAISAIYAVIFGLSLDYQVFLITRMREGWLRTGETPAAIRYGLERTAAVVTGAAAIMIAVFLAFATSDIATTRQFGVGLAIAVFLDATLVRLLLLPATMRLCGDACWRGPKWLRRFAH